MCVFIESSNDQILSDLSAPRLRSKRVRPLLAGARLSLSRARSMVFDLRLGATRNNPCSSAVHFAQCLRRPSGDCVEHHCRLFFLIFEGSQNRRTVMNQQCLIFAGNFGDIMDRRTILLGCMLTEFALAN